MNIFAVKEKNIKSTSQKVDGLGCLPLSIITICRNEQLSIRGTAESIKKQTCKEFEWIVIDGGSTDDTVKILMEYRSDINHFVSESDAGIYDAMNKGSKEAKGNYLLFLNGGDRLADTHVVEDLLPKLVLKPDILMGDYYFEHSNGICELREASRRPVTVHRLYRSCLTHCASLIRTDLFRVVGEYDISFRIMGDYDWFLRAILRHGAVAEPFHRTLSIFNSEGISSMQKKTPLTLNERRRLRREYFPMWYGIRWALNEAVGRLQTMLGRRL